MKNILAENLLRFGVKNLSESEKYAVQTTLLRELKNPVTIEKISNPSTKSYGQRVVCSYQGWEGGQRPVPCMISAALVTTNPDGKTGLQFKSRNIRFEVTNIESGRKEPVFLELQTNAAFTLKGFDGKNYAYSGPGNIPINAVKAVIASLNKIAAAGGRLGSDYFLDPAAETQISAMKNYYRVTTKGVKGTGILKPAFTFWREQLRNPETEQVISDSIKSMGTERLILTPGSTTVSAESIINRSGSEKTIKSWANSIKVSPQNWDMIQQDYRNWSDVYKEDIVNDLVKAYSNILANSPL